MSATSRRRSLPRIVTFVVSAVAYNAVMAAAGAVSPLLITYQQEWRFPAWQLTAAFSVYPLTLLLSLLVVGGLSDFVGRKPLLIAALVIQLAAVMLFLTSGNIWGITLARAIQGVAAGIATSTFSPYLNEVSPRRLQKTASIVVAIAPLGGLGIGAILAGVAIQFVSDPASVVFLVALVLFACTLALLLFGEETVTSVRGAAASLVPRIRIPQAARAQFATVAPGLVGVWMSAGLMLGLVASIAEAEFHISGGVVNGVIVALQPIAASVATIFIGPRIKAQKLVPLGYVTVIAGVAMAAAAFEWAVLPLLFVGAVVTGVGLGLAFSGVLRTLVPLTKVHERAELFSAVYLVGYVAYGVPTIAIGLLVDVVGLTGGALVHSAAIVVATVIGLIVYNVRGSRRAKTRSESEEPSAERDRPGTHPDSQFDQAAISADPRTQGAAS